MSLSRGTKIARYEILSLIGTGGMGEVYLAKDSRLGRKVALKILNSTGDANRIRRFLREARAASALNHPNILSVYDFGQQDSLYFIVTEYLEGKTLRQMISERALDLTRTFQLAIQVGDSLAAAHKAGIVHRDIKPENIIVSSDGYVKVLDFGLAKLNESRECFGEGSTESTVSLLQTKPGMLVGTVNYMSPEQLRGQEVDERTDLWSLGVVIFEMVTGRRPFTGDSMSDVIAAILERSVEPVTLPSPVLSTSLDTVLSKALAKEKENRYQNAQSIVEDLKNVEARVSREGTDSFPQPPSSIHRRKVTEVVRRIFPARIRRARVGRIALACALLATAGAAFAYFLNLTRPRDSASRQTRSRPFPVLANVLNAVISPNGQFIAYVSDEAGQQSLRVRQVTESADSVLIAPQKFQYASLQFSNDSNSIFYTIFADSPTGALYRKPILGGSEQKILDDIDSPVTFSPDGKRLAFIRSDSHGGRDQIVVSDVDGGHARVLSEREYPERYSINSREGLAWSQDGKTIASAAGSTDLSGERMSVVLIDVSSGGERPATTGSWYRVGRVLWGKTDDTLVITAAEFGTDLYQIWRLSLSGNESRKLTTELNDYLNISQSADSKILLAVADDRTCNLFVAPAQAPDRASQIAGGNLDGMGGIEWAPDGRLFYVSVRSGNLDIWITESDGTKVSQITFDPAADEYPSISNDGKKVSFVSSRAGVPHVWLMQSDGTNPKQLTFQGGESYPRISPDGESVFYSSKPLRIWKTPILGGEPLLATETPANWIAISPDGAKFAALTMSPGKPMMLTVFSCDTGLANVSFPLTGEVATPGFPPSIRWMPTGKAISYVSTQDGVSNIVVQGLNKRETQKVTNFSADRIFSFGWSRDGSKIAFARGTARNKLLLFEEF